MSENKTPVKRVVFGPSESARQALNRCRVKPIQTSIPFIDKVLGSGLQPGQVLEVSGRSCTGKSEILYQALISCCLPSMWNGIPLGGQDCGAVVVDLDFRFSILRLHSIVEAHVAGILQGCSETEEYAKAVKKLLKGRTIEAFTDESKEVQTLVNLVNKRIAVVQCETFTQLVVAIKQLPDVVRSQRLLVIDNIAAFFWVLRYQQKQAQMDQLIALLKKTLLQLHMPLIVTKPVLFLRNNEDQPNEYLGTEWSKLVTWRCRLRRIREMIPQPPSSLDFEQLTDLNQCMATVDGNTPVRFYVTNNGLLWQTA